MFYLLSEPGYATSSWCNHIIDGILEEKRSKRFNIVVISSVQETDYFSPQSNDAILLIGSNSTWLKSVIDICSQKFGKNIIVLGNFERQLNGKNYSIISTDISMDIYNLYAYLIYYSKKNIALYGVNPNSASDIYRKKSFIECCGQHNNIYYNNGNLKECFQGFISDAEQYDAVICTNDYAAISLARFLHNNGTKSPFIVSCGETKLAQMFKPSITGLRTSYKDVGKAVIHVYRLLQKDISISGIKLNLASCIIPGDSTDNLPVLPISIPEGSPSTTPVNDPFYCDSEVSEMMKIEKLLNHCDKFELDMLFSLIEGATYTALAENYHISVNGLKYKLNKLFELCDVHSKSEFIEMFKKYIH